MTTEPEAKPKSDKKERDPRLIPLFEKGADCKWDDNGMTQCPTNKEVNKLAFNNQGNKKLAESCADALSDPNYAVRGLAISCVRGLNDMARTPILAIGLDAYENEEDLGLRHALSWALRGNAAEAGIETRVIDLIGKLASDPSTETHAANLFTLLFPQYMAGSPTPSKEAGDAAFRFVGSSAKPVWEKAINALGLLKERSTEACPVLIKHTDLEASWAKAIIARSKLGEECLRDLDPVIDRIAAELSDGKLRSYEKLALQGILRNAILSGAQTKLLKKASKKNVSLVKGNMAKSAAKLDAAIKDYEVPVVSE